MTKGRKACLSGDTCQPETEREAWYCQLLHHRDTRAEDIAEDPEIDMNADTLRHMVDPNSRESWLPSRKVERLLALTPGHFPVMRFYASRSNGVFFPFSSVSTDKVDADAVKQFGELLVSKAEAYGDGVVSQSDASTIEREAYEAIAAIVGIVEDAKRKAAQAKREPWRVVPIGVAK